MNDDRLTRRLNRGAGHSYELDGIKVPGVTTILSKGVAKPGLIDAAARETANYAVNNWDDLAREGLAQRLRKIEKGRYDVWNRATARGTKIHAYAAELIGGGDVAIPDAYRDPVDQCLAFLSAWDVREIAAEVTIVNRRYRFMGTVDLIGRVGDEDDVWLWDWKTGASGVWPETALQLAAYAHAETMLVEGPDGTPASFEIAFPRIARAAAVWLQSDHYEVVPVDISEDTFRTFLYAQQMARFADAPRSDYVGEPLDAPMFERET